MTTWKPWADGLVKRVADAMRSIRVAEGRTAASLAARTGVGKPLTRAVISDLETGRKKTLDVSELLTIAAALKISPLSLLLPNVLDDVEMLPGKLIPGTDALAWFLGVTDAPGQPLAAFNFGDNAMQLATRIVEVDNLLRVQRHNAAQHTRGLELAEAGTVGMPDNMKTYEESNLDHANKQIELLENERRDLVHKYSQMIAERTDG